MSTPAKSPSSSIEARLLALESTLGLIPDSAGAGANKNTRDIESRLDRLLAGEGPLRAPPSKSTSSAAPSRGKLDDDLREIDRLTSELGPGSTLTNAAANAPLLYRRQDVLASSESMRRDMNQVAQIRDLLLISSRSSGAAGGDGPSAAAEGRGAGRRSGERFVNSPVLSSDRYDFPSDPEAHNRLDAVCWHVADLNARAVAAATRVDDMINRYHRIMSVVSEKMVLADEEISEKGAA